MLRRCVSFLPVTSGHGFEKKHVVLQVSSKFNRQIHPNAPFEQSIEEIWTQKLEKNSLLFNGTKFRLNSMTLTTSSLKMQWGLTDYKTYIGLSSRCDLIESIKAQEQEYSKFLSNKIGVAAALVTQDGLICFLKRSQNVGAYPNMMDVPGGHPEPQNLQLAWDSMPDALDENINTRCVDELFNSIENEILEEVNIPLSALSPPILLGVTLQGEAETPSFAFLIHTKLTSDGIRELYGKGPQDQYETTQLAFQSIDHLSTRSIELTPSAAGCIELFLEYQTFQR